MIEIARAMLKIAEELVESGRIEKSELKYRAAVNRAYYCVFLFARAKTGLENEIHDVHGSVLSRLYPRFARVRKTETFNSISKLRKYREQADYAFPTSEPECQDWEKCATNAVIQAGFALNHLERL